MRISKSTKTSTKTSVKASWQDEPTEEQMRSDLINDGWDKLDINSLDYDDLYARWLGAGFDVFDGSEKSIKSCNSSTSTDKALQHITAAIDILGKSGKKDDVTKDIIANLAVVAMDIKASKR